METRRRHHGVLTRLIAAALLAGGILLPARPAAAALGDYGYRRFPWHAGVKRTITTKPGECPHCKGDESSSAWKAIDVGLNYETVYSVGMGTVVTNSQSGGLAGWYLQVKDPDGSYITYEHLSAAPVSVNDTIVPGQPIATSGCSGNCWGAHLHFQRSSGTSFSSTAMDLTPISGYSAVSDTGYYSDNAGVGYSSGDSSSKYIRAEWLAVGGTPKFGATADISEWWSPCRDDSIYGNYWRYNCAPNATYSGTLQTYLSSSGAERAIMYSSRGGAHTLERGILGAYTDEAGGHDWVYWIGYPISNRYLFDTGWYEQDFESGWIWEQPSNCLEYVFYNSSIYQYGYCDT